ncbi:2-oxo-4-hydroxy-4-carboxy-5-ureidoimidazoline decarboxylase [Glaciihabitans sp. INWT7]|uniref:2-oxo-4-hydroxy-4-carboxy-5-ureidoimidazoline decarboxylase n=1 Tax=Glaciihabitans sp. INWT7 TaxID=2596912 RepID=UPI001626639A|nr:2-oxo-4-hydroxy-4-carboxy-5-ureidoimidazoline decarboxylase [Glaciihabitans sp. INWT7]QNE46075.1 2-oxo-4-hydroxy-4-carboxy-5-ureidoimidazoline decarboxylase [Glaciihabitans sp. INWT7]
MIELPLTELRAGLMASLAVPRWVDDVVRVAPFESVSQLLDVASAAATPLSASEIDEAIAHHPRIGEKPVGDGAAQAFSRNEQAGLGSDEEDLAAEIAAGNVAYEQRFGRVFIIRAAGRSRAEILTELERRLELPNSSELEIVGEQLRDIALLRIERLWATPAEDDLS